MSSGPQELADHVLFDHLSEEQRDLLASCTTLVRFPAGVTILKEGDPSLDSYLLRRGRLRVKRDTPYGTFSIAFLEPGTLFGETAFIDRLPRSVDVLAEEDSELLLLNPVALAAQTEKDRRFELAVYWVFWKSLSAKLRATNDRLTRFFSETGQVTEAEPLERRDPTGSFRLDMGQKRDLFQEQKLSRMEINFLASLSQERRFDAGEILFREGDPGDSMYIVLDGKVRISKDIPGAGEEALAFVERGDYFGEMALIDNEPRSAVATAHDGGAVVLSIPREVVSGLLDIRKVSSLRLLRILCNLAAKRLREIDDKLVGWFILAGGQGGRID